MMNRKKKKKKPWEQMKKMMMIKVTTHPYKKTLFPPLIKNQKAIFAIL